MNETAELDKINELLIGLPSWVKLEKLTDEDTDLCHCGTKAEYIILGPDYPYCEPCLRKVDKD